MFAIAVIPCVIQMYQEMYTLVYTAINFWIFCGYLSDNKNILTITRYSMFFNDFKVIVSSISIKLQHLIHHSDTNIYEWDFRYI